MTTVDINLGAMTARLEGARRRARWNLLAAAGGIAVAAGLAVLLILEALRRFLPDVFADSAGRLGLPAGSDEAATSLVVAGAVAVLVAVATIAMAILRTPMLAKMARAADRTFLLQERVSTALEIGAAGRPGLIGTALLRDTEARAASVDQRRLVPARLPTPIWVALGLLAAVIVVELLPPADRSASNGAGPTAFVMPPAQLPEPEQAAVAAEIERVADLVMAEAADRDDPVLEAMSRTLERVSQETASADAVDREQLVAELGRLADSGRAMGLGGLPADSAARSDPGAMESLEALLRDLAPQPATPAEEAFGGLPAPGSLSPLGTPRDTSTPPPGAIPGGGEVGRGNGANQELTTDIPAGSIGGIQVTFDDASDFVQSSPRGGGTPRADAAQGEIGVEAQGLGGSMLSPSSGAPSPNGSAAGLPGAEGQTPGVLAGAGVQGDAVGAETAIVDFETMDDGMILEAEINAAGRRIQIDVPPTPQVTASTAPPPPPPSEAWRLLSETGVARLVLNPAARDLVARYFMARPAEPAP